MVNISVIIPVYNRQKQAMRAINSVIDQENWNVELIVVDDFSHPPFVLPDELTSNNRIRIIRHSINKGAGAARNTGLKISNGNFIAFLDSDDIWRPGKLDAQIALIKKLPVDDKSMLTAIVCGFRLKSAVTQKDRQLQPISSENLNDFVSGCWFCPGSTLIVSRTAFDIVGLYDENLRRLEDTDWFIRFVIAGGSIISANDIWVDIEAGTKAESELVKSNASYLIGKHSNYTNKSALNPLQVRYLKSYLALELAASQVAHNNKVGAFFSLLKSFWFKPRLQLQLKNWWKQN